MPPRKRRQSVPGEDQAKEVVEKVCTGASCASNTVENEKVVKATPKVTEVSCSHSEKRLTARQQSIQDANAEKVKQTILAAPVESTPKPAPPQPTRFSTRVVKRPRREFSPVESSPVKKAVKTPKVAQGPDGKGSTTPETKTKRQWELWSVEDKDTFFEGLCEYGKDFDSIHNAIVVKYKKKGSTAVAVKNKEQVRHFYYRTWHKIAKLIQPKEDLKKDIQELYGLISYGVLRKKLRRGVNVNDKNWQKLNELVHFGATTIKVKGKRIRIKTPMCKALKKLNNIEEPRRDPGPKVPDKVKVEFRPKTNHAWSQVQELSQNPRLRMTVRPDRCLESLIKFLDHKWRPHRLKIKECMAEPEVPLQELRVFPHRDSTVTRINLEAVDEPVYRFSLNNHKDTCSIHCSPTSTKRKKDVAEPRKSGSSAVPENSSQAIKAVITDFKCCSIKDLCKPDNNRNCASTSKETTNSKTCTNKNCSCKDANKMSVCKACKTKCTNNDSCKSTCVKDTCTCADANGNIFYSETVSDSDKCTRINSVQTSLNFLGAGKGVMFEACENESDLLGARSTSTSDISAMADGENAMFPDFGTNESTANEYSDAVVKTEVVDMENVSPAKESEMEDNVKTVEASQSGMVRVCHDAMNRGWSLADVDTVTIAELYFMFGKDGELRFEYEWCNKQPETALTPDLVLANLNNKLQRLFNLATVEFTDFSKTPGIGSPCHLCGQTFMGRPASKGKEKSPTGKLRLCKASSREIGVQTHGNVIFQPKVQSNNMSPSASLTSPDGVFRVPTATPTLSATQKSILSMSAKELVQRLNPNNPSLNRLMRPRKLKSVSRRPASQRTILPKAELSTQQMVTVYVPNPVSSDNQNLVSQTIVGHPVGIQTRPASPCTTVNVNSPSAMISSPSVTLTNLESAMISIPSPQMGDSTGDILDSQLESGRVTPPNTYSGLDMTLSPGDGDHTLLRISSSELLKMGSLSPEALKAAGMSTRESPMKTEPAKKSPSPPNLSSLLDMSFSNMGSEDGVSKSPLTVDPGLATPPLRSSSDHQQTNPLHSPTDNPEPQWLNGEVADMSLTSFLELPMKSETSSANYTPTTQAFTLQPLSLFNESSRDSQSARIDVATVESTLQCMMNESSVDYMRSFANLAEEIFRTERPENGHRKPETSTQTA